VSTTPDPSVRRVDIQVFEGDAQEPVASLSGFAASVITP
jgi:hypothetical protein